MTLAVASLCGVFFVASTTGASAAGDLAETARFLAGKGDARTQDYADYSAQIASDWKQFEQPNLERIRKWFTGRGPANHSTVFYPFSGPDIANALAFFPDADSYLLFGLEAPGEIPNLRGMDDAAITAGLTELKASLGTMLQVNYFFTKTMEKKLGKGSFSSITGLLLFFLATSDYEVTGARKISIGRGGAVVEGTAGIRGIEITFRRSGNKQQTLRYFMVNVADTSLAKSSANFLPYLESQGRLVTVIKSASYLMHDGVAAPEHFAQIRSRILAQSDFVVQDDSGVPLRFFARDTWKLRFHGMYEAPTPEFGKRLQKDLKVEMHMSSTGKLPFSYGYAYKEGESNLMTAERAP